MDKAFWLGVIDAEYAVPDGHNAAELTGDLFEFLSASDPDLRDDIGYGVFVRWLIAGHYTPDDLRGWLSPLLANLERGIDESHSDMVFLRSFSALWLAAITYYDNHAQQFLTEDEFNTLNTAVAAYFLNEQDVRGYIPGKGWAHSCAHTADLIDELVKSRYLEAEGIAAWLDHIADKVLMPSAYRYIHDEDERLAVAVLSALNRDAITAAHVADWLSRFSTWQEVHPRYSYVNDTGLWNAYLHAKNLLRSVFVRLHGAEELPDSTRAYAPVVLETLKLFSLPM